MSFDLPARDVLRLAGQTSIAWAVFEPDWYLRTYPETAAALADAPPEAVLAWYLQHGQGMGHSPNILFDERWHRQAYPGVAAAVRAGHVASAFDSYCRGGHTTRSPHWLFNAGEYRRRYPDLSDDVLQAAELANGYDHYLRHGAAEHRIGHALFEPACYAGGLEPEDALAAGAQPFLHYLRRIESGTAETRTSVYFDPAWYLQRYPRVAEELTNGVWLCALQHYLCNDTPTEFDPLPEFSEKFYLARNPDLAEVVARGDRRNGYAHYLSHGAFELRSPCEAINLRWYAGQEQVRAALEQGRVGNPFEHWLRTGRHEGLLSAPPPEERVTEGQANTLFRRKAQNLQPLFARSPLDFAFDGKPSISAIMVLHDRFPLTLQALGSLRQNFAGEIELILVDSGSTDETRHITRYVHGARVLRFETDIGFLRGCNAALLSVTADSVLLLDNDVELAPRAVAAALQRLCSDPKIGAVGGKVIRAHGLLQEAGSIVWRDGTTQGYLREASPLVPEANFVRDVDYCSAVFLLLRAGLLQQLDGFDDAFAPARYGDVDLCVRINLAGYRVVYDPAVVIHHLEHDSAPETNTGAADVNDARLVFFRKHLDWLRRRYITDQRVQVFARETDLTVQHVLFVEDMLPVRQIGSGFVRSNDLIRSMAAMGYHVTVFPVMPSRSDLATILADMPDSVEVMHGHTIDDLADFLTQRHGYYDTIWIARTHNLDRIRPMLERITIGAGRPPRIVLDTEAIAALRLAQQAKLADEPGFDLDAAILREFANAHFCQAIVAVSEAEAQQLRDLDFRHVAVIGHVRALKPMPRSFDRRAGMLFVGAMHRMDSPNYDSLCWFVDAVLPLVEQELGWETRLTVVGYTGADVALDRFREHPRVTLRGAVADIEPLYDSHRLFVAPTRIAAGTPYKVYEAASYGLPVVATELLHRQLGWEAEQELLVAPMSDAALFARQVVRLYRDAALWQTLRSGALARLRQENGQEDYAAAIEAVLGPVRLSVER